MTKKRFTVPAILFLLFLVTTNIAGANGGQVRLEREESGPYLISVFTEPIPMREGEVDVSAQILNAETGAIIDENLTLLLTVSPLDAEFEASPIEVELTSEEATDPGYYAAKFDIPATGEWNFQIVVSGAAGEGMADFDANVDVQRTFGLTEILVGAALVPFVGIIIWLAMRGSRGQPAESQEPAE